MARKCQPMSKQDQGDKLLIDRIRHSGAYLAGEQPVCWLAVAMALGIVAYFALPFEPSIWPSIVVACLSGGILWSSRHHHTIFRAGLMAVFIVIGFLAAQVETARHDTQFLARDIGPVSMTGRVTSTEPLRTGVRLTLDQTDIRRLEPFEEPTRVRISTRSAAAELIKAGDWVQATVSLSPPSTPTVPG